MPNAGWGRVDAVALWMSVGNHDEQRYGSGGELTWKTAGACFYIPLSWWLGSLPGDWVAHASQPGTIKLDSSKDGDATYQIQCTMMLSLGVFVVSKMVGDKPAGRGDGWISFLGQSSLSGLRRRLHIGQAPASAPSIAPPSSRRYCSKFLPPPSFNLGLSRALGMESNWWPKGKEP